MIVSDVYKLLDQFSYCSLKDLFSLPTNRFQLLELLDINWDKFEKDRESFRACVYDGSENTFSCVLIKMTLFIDKLYKKRK